MALAACLAGRAANFLRAGPGDGFNRRVVPAFAAARFARDRAFDVYRGFTAGFGRAFTGDTTGVNSMIAAPLP